MSFDKKIETIQKYTGELQGKVRNLSDQLLKEVIDGFVDQLDVKDGIVQNTTRNVALLNQIDQLVNRFNAQVVAPQVTGIVQSGVNSIGKFNTDYFSQFADAKSKYEASRKKVQQTINDRLGFGDKTKLKEGGFMASMFADTSIQNQIKDYSRTELIKGPGFKAFKDGLKKLIVSDRDNLGAFERHYRQYSYDIFVIVDREESILMAKELKLTYFIYSGTIIESSRDFCVDRAGKVFTMDEAKTWINDPWIKKNLEKGYIASYNPIIDMGLFQCRHSPQFISKETAERLRPDLKNTKK